MKFFISSTAYDLHDFRVKIQQILKREHQDYITFENPSFPTQPRLHSHDQCLAAVKNADFVICILDKRYGSRYAGNHKRHFKDFDLEISGYTKAGKRKTFCKPISSKKLSITWCELIKAQRHNKKIFTFVRQKLADEKEVRRQNQFFKSFRPAYAEKEELYDLIDWITKSRRNNWIETFNDLADFAKKFRQWLKALCNGMPMTSDAAKSKGAYSVNLYQRSKGVAPKTVISFVVEGETDRSFISLVLRKLSMNIEARFIVTYGKYRMFHMLTEYLENIGPANAVFILYDTDGEDRGKTAERNSLLKNTTYACPVEVFPVEPEIETWINAGLKGRKHLPGKSHFRDTRLEADFDLDYAQKRNSAFKNFIERLQHYGNAICDN